MHNVTNYLYREIFFVNKKNKNVFAKLTKFSGIFSITNLFDKVFLHVDWEKTCSNNLKFSFWNNVYDSQEFLTEIKRNENSIFQLVWNVFFTNWNIFLLSHIIKWLQILLFPGVCLLSYFFSCFSSNIIYWDIHFILTIRFLFFCEKYVAAVWGKLFVLVLIISCFLSFLLSFWFRNLLNVCFKQTGKTFLHHSQCFLLIFFSCFLLK